MTSPRWPWISGRASGATRASAPTSCARKEGPTGGSDDPPARLRGCALLMRRHVGVRRAAVPPLAAVVLLADELVEADLLPLGVQLHLELVRPGRSEDLGIVDGQPVVDRVRILEGQPLDRVKGVGVHPVLRWILIVVVVERPPLEVPRVDDQRS